MCGWVAPSCESYSLVWNQSAEQESSRHPAKEARPTEQVSPATSSLEEARYYSKLKCFEVTPFTQP